MRRAPHSRRRASRACATALVALLCLGCTTQGTTVPETTAAEEDTEPAEPTEPTGHDRQPRGRVTLAFVGDMHFQIQLAGLLTHPRGALGPIARALGAADVTMANLESAVTEGGTLEAKELENPGERYWFRASPAAFDVLDQAGIDVVTMANNHGADYGPTGLADTLRAIRTSRVGVVGIGRDKASALAPYRVDVRGTRIAFLAADASPREGSSSVWSAGPSDPGIARAREDPRALVAAVRAAGRTSDVVVVYLHWGTENRRCPDPTQRRLASTLSRAGADVVVGSHAHVLQGAGFRGDTYVAYGLGNFLWYHNRVSSTGVLRVDIEDGEVVGDRFAPAEISTFGRPSLLRGPQRTDALQSWERLRACTGLTDAGR